MQRDTAMERAITDPRAPSANAAHGAEALVAQGVTMRWPRASTPVLDGLDLVLCRGEVSWIGGKNGVGKTTLLRVLAGILVPNAGSIRLNGLSPADDRAAYVRGIGFLSAGDRGLHARMRVWQHLDYWARLAYVPAVARQSAVEREIDAFGLSDHAKTRVDRLSQGWRQRVRLAMSFLHAPSVVLLDEPRNSLDEDGYQVLRRRVQRVASEGGTVLWCSPRGEERVIDVHRSYALIAGKLESTG